MAIIMISAFENSTHNIKVYHKLFGTSERRARHATILSVHSPHSRSIVVVPLRYWSLIAEEAS